MAGAADRILRWVLPTLGGLLGVAAYAFPVLVRGGSLFATDGDPGRHIRLGTYMIESRSIPNVDLFSHTMRGEHFIPYEWLSEAMFAASHIAAGLAGVALLTAALFASTVALVYVMTRRLDVPAPVALVIAFTSMVLQAVHLHARPHMFTTLLAATFAFVLLETRRDHRVRRLLWLPPLMLLWANVHGGFLVGFILLVMFAFDGWLSRRFAAEAVDASYSRALWGTLGLCVVASLLTPAGWELWPHTTGYLGEEWLVAFTQEYNSPDFHDPLLKFFLAVLLSGAALLGLLRVRVDLLGLFTWLLFAAFSLHSARNIPLFAVLALPWVARWLVAAMDQYSDAAPVLGRTLIRARRMSDVELSLPGWPVVLVGIALISALTLAPSRSASFRFSAEAFPVDAVEHLLETGFEAPGPVYNEFAWGGYLLYRAYPEYPVFIDGQTDFYGEELTQEYVRIRGLAPDWRILLDAHRIGWALIPPEVALNQAFEIDADWSRVYSDSTAVVWVRDPPR